MQDELSKFQKGTIDISSYYTALKTLWEEIESFHSIRDCSCAIPCTCRAIFNVKNYREQDYVLELLKGLNEQYSYAKSQIMMMDPLHSIHKAFSLLIQQERIHLVSTTTDSVTAQSSAMAMTVQSGFSSKPAPISTNPNTTCNGRPRPNTERNQGTNHFCTHCRRHNCTIDTCQAWISSRILESWEAIS